MTGPGPLHDSLSELADSVLPIDLYERSLRRSRRIGRREAAVGTGAAVVALGLLGSGLWQMPQPSGDSSPRGVAAAPLNPSPGATGAPQGDAGPAPIQSLTPGRTTSRPHRPRPQAPASTRPRSTSLAALPGQVFYQDAGTKADLVRLTRDGDPRTVLSAPFSAVGVSPDGARVAYVTEGQLMVVDTAGGEPQQVYAGTASDAQAPAWSPDGGRLLIDATDPGVLDVATGALTPLPTGLDGEHFRWSGDGTTLVYATTSCRLEVAGVNAQTGTPVPATQDTGGAAACRPVSVDSTGDLVTVRTEQAGAADTDAPADAVLDTSTGETVDLPVPGTVIGAVFDAQGNLLVRSVQRGRTRLSLFDPGFTLLLRAKEPAALKDLDLVAYTR
ncbi:hypothetical protein COUCH_36750 [Couchioplanes caeruleus]|uniref:TolB family protein n=1 Tax=Couchioplanes caeruleus TaxID=56438 RepID=UPI0020BE480B|nr:hypothetical protein [Couchioplanes caeruleus]UQU64446.1 hypothetical protein COUCH_36750 [Couchioplanes caeruleus]